MSYQVLARKWRPQCYADVVGQRHVLAVLSNSCTRDRLHHAYLFSGSRGVGKTTLARLFAKGLNCATGITATPCRQCGPCQEIEQGRFVDLLEIDAASRTKVEDTRELLDNIHYAPASGRFKIYLIDEVHMLSRHSFNALLKTLEEPPPHVKFLLATTDPQKLPATLLSRCLQLHLQLLSVEKIEAQLQKIVQAEALEAEPQALRLLARAAQGSLRDALTLTDQALAIGEGRLSVSLVSQLLGTLDTQQAVALVEALHQAEAASLLKLVDQLIAQGRDCEQLLVEMAAVLHQIALQQWLPQPLGEPGTGAVRIRELAQRIAPPDLQLYYQTLLMGRQELPLAPDPRMGVEMTLLRALAFHPKQIERGDPAGPSGSAEASVADPVVDSPLASRISTSDRPKRVAPTERPRSLAPVKNVSVMQERQASEESSLVTHAESEPSETTQLLAIHQQLRGQQRQHRQQRQQSTTMISSPGALPQPPLSKTGPAERAAASPRLAPAVPKVPPDNRAARPSSWKAAAERDEWSAEVARLTLPKRIEQLALNSVCEAISPQEIRLHLRTAQRHLNRPEAPDLLASALSELRGQPVTVTILDSEDVSQRTPLEWRQAIDQEQLSAARQALLADEHLQRLQRDFGAEIDEATIQPL
ncbi:DNA polymerase III subunit gamma/tau [unidentified bacterial endosymbiont]|uniref:DNA polymerase III subunit gamma/tau n=1 Tax=unidentified bacterial endosymbiont TaxID=2355 RepID=UPI0020A197AD|nr:DNA polymerase III subunit gamma/tau [unidentified bacterial endosymbiont]